MPDSHESQVDEAGQHHSRFIHPTHVPGNTKKIGQLQLEQDMRHQRREWRAEYVGWALMFLILVSAVAGILGPGPVSETVAGDHNSNLWIDYERISRYEAPSELRIHFRQPDSRRGETHIALNRDFNEGVEVQTISPLPHSTTLTHDLVQFTFPADTSQGPTAVTIHFHPTQRGRHLFRSRPLADHLGNDAQAMVDNDHSMTNGWLLILTLIGMSILFSHLKQWFPTFDKWANGVPMLIFDNGRFLRDRMQRARVSEDEILEAARVRQGLRSIDEVAYAVLEPSGEITVVPRRGEE